MFFEDWATHKKESISKAILWEYNTMSETWDWNVMSKTVVACFIERRRYEDYHAMFQLYGGIRNVKEIIKSIPHLNKKGMNWYRVLFNLKTRRA